MLHTIKKVEALYPKLDRPYKFDKKEKKITALKKRTSSYKVKRESIIENLANEFNKHLNLSSLLN